MDLLDVMTAIGAAFTGTVPVAIVLLWLIWREVRNERQSRREGRTRTRRDDDHQEDS